MTTADDTTAKAIATPGDATLRRKLVEAGAHLTSLGLSPGASGNVSIRQDDTIVMSPTGTSLGQLNLTDLSVLDFDGTLLEGPKPSKEFPFHRAFYRRDTAARAVVHVHSVAALAVSCLDPWRDWSAVPPLTPYFVMRVGQTPLVPYADPGDTGQADQIEAIPFPVRAVLLQNHGAVACGATMDEALEAIIELEQTCEILLRLGSRSTHLVDDEAAERLALRYGSPWTQGRAH
jgi:ribulose-5-phosphate 4-epimerase/fuculose-1-phosphate aldolase